MASQGIRTKPENPLEKSVRLENEEKARQAAIRQEDDRKAELARQAQWAEDQRLQAQEERQSQYAADMARAERDAEERADNAAYQRAVRAQSRDKRLRESRSSPAWTFSAPSSSGGSGGLSLTVEKQQPTTRAARECWVCRGSGICRTCNGSGKTGTKVVEDSVYTGEKIQPGSVSGAITSDMFKATKRTVSITCDSCGGSGKCYGCGGSGKLQ